MEIRPVAAPSAARPAGNSAARPLRPSKKRWPFPLNLYQNAVGKKWVMAVTGIMLLGFVLFHMFGNIKLYIGVIEHNGENIYDVDLYGEFLRELLVPLFPRTWFLWLCLLYTSPSPRDATLSRMPSSA